MRPRALVTGASRGIGAAIAVRLARAGWDIAVHHHTGEAEARDVAALVAGEGARAVVLRADVSDAAECARLVEGAVAGLGGLEAVVANAGVYDRAHLDELPPERWARTMATNLSGTFLVVRAAVPHLRAGVVPSTGQDGSGDGGSGGSEGGSEGGGEGGSEGGSEGGGGGGGGVVLVSSQLARLGSAHGAHYAASKAAVEGLTRALGLELAPHGVRVNCVAPGMTRTAILAPYTEEELARRAQGVPARRIGEPGDVASAVAFLLSTDASYMTGAVLHVNGGMLMA